MNVKLFLIILLTVATLTSSSYSQDSTLTVQFFGFIQTDLKYCPVTGENEISARRSRIGIKKQFNPFNFRIQYDFSTQKLMDSWFGYNLSKDIEIRVGRSFVFLPGDVIKSPSKIETIDRPAVGSLFYPRYNGILVFDKYKSLNYNINLVNGTCFQPETDKNKDLMSMFWFENSIAKIELASYIGRLEKQEKSRYIVEFELYLRSLDIETVALRGKDLGIESEGGVCETDKSFL